MALETRGTFLSVGAGTAFVLGLGTIFLGDVMLTTLGVVLVILSVILFLAVVKDFIVGRDSVEP